MLPNNQHSKKNTSPFLNNTPHHPRPSPSTPLPIPLRIPPLPAPHIPAHGIQITFRPPAQQLFGAAGVGPAGGDVAGAAGGEA